MNALDPYRYDLRTMQDTHTYSLTLGWKGNNTSSYATYDRSYGILIPGKPELVATADPLFHGEPGKHNPEDLLVAALSGCHLLTYLALCARARINVVHYEDQASGDLTLTKDGGGYFQEVTLRPVVVVAEDHMVEKALRFHDEVHKYCFIARSVNFPVRHLAKVRSR